jgi:predicted pyridoxine 5'-phosphate oxidase superfamily flavin-nucleotide-binding protein
MRHNFGDIAFTDRVKALQESHGSRAAYSRMEGGEAQPDRLGPAESAFLAARDSFYMATVSETGWPYVQHRGGPPGFVRVLDDHTIGFADFRGNQQFVSLGNLTGDDRVALILVDYPRRRRLKILGHARAVSADNDPAWQSRFEVEGYPARAERALEIEVVAFDWNCPQHITPRFTEAEIAAAVAPLHARIAELEAALADR